MSMPLRGHDSINIVPQEESQEDRRCHADAVPRNELGAAIESRGARLGKAVKQRVMSSVMTKNLVRA